MSGYDGALLQTGGRPKRPAGKSRLAELLETGSAEDVYGYLMAEQKAKRPFDEAYHGMIASLRAAWGGRPVYSSIHAYSIYPGVGDNMSMLWADPDTEIAMCVSCRTAVHYWFLTGIVPPFPQAPEVPRRLNLDLLPSVQTNHLRLGGRVVYLLNTGFFYLCDACVGAECGTCKKSRFPNLANTEEVLIAGLENACGMCFRRHPTRYQVPALVGPKWAGLRSVKARLKGGYFIVK